MHNIANVINAFNKRATAVLTPEAMQAAIQPPMDPAAAGGAPMDPSMGGMPGGAPMGGAPADPAAMGGAPTAPQGSGGGAIPPEILNDQLFMQFMQAMGVTFDPQSGNFIDPNGQPLSVDEVTQIYDMFQQQVAAQQGGAAEGAAAADPAMGGAPMDPAAMGAPMGDPAAMAGMPPEAAAEVPPAGPEAMVPAGPDMGGDPAMGAADPAMDPAAVGGGAATGAEDPVMEIASAVMTGVEATLEDFTQALTEKISSLMEKIEDLSKAVEAIEKTKDGRSDDDKKEQLSVEDELAADLALDENIQPVAEPVPPMLSPKTASMQAPQPINLYNFICKKA